MQNIIIEKPYRFIPPHRGTGWSYLIKRFNLHGIYLRRVEGVESYECRHVDKLRASLAAGHGIMLTPNHSRNGDPLVLGWLAREVGCHVYAMASWHLFHQDRLTAWAIRQMGGFSINREGVDRQAIATGIEVLEQAERPLVIFPEGAVTRTNDRLHALLDGVAFVARAAAKRRAKHTPGGRVVIHPIAIKYFYQGDLTDAAEPVLTEIEQRLTWRPNPSQPLYERVVKIGLGLLALKELEYLGGTYNDPLAQRLDRLINRLLCPLEHEWLGGAQSGPVVPRVKNLRMKILPEMVQGTLTAEERARRWAQLADIYLAQQVSCYPPDYLASPLTVDRLLETIERYECDLTDRVRVHGKLKAVIDVGDALEVTDDRPRGAADPLMHDIEVALQGMLDRLAGESPIWSGVGAATSTPASAASAAASH